MCFSVNVNLVKEELENRFGATLIDPDKYRPSYYYHAFAVPELPVICSGDTGNIRLFRWGLIPSGTVDSAKADDIKSKTFNARAESLSEKPSFSSAFKSKRCVIPVKGFYEWQHRGSEKIPWYIYGANNQIILLAGLYENWVSDKSGETINTFTVITTTANDLLTEIHNSAKRMPVIFGSGEEKLWLDGTAQVSSLNEILRPTDSELLKAHTIGPLVNSKTAEKNNPEVIRPYSYGNLLF
jgi:putative SOS response-associated peptidase YedK